MTSTQATRSLHIAAVACIFAAPAAVAAPTSYPLTIENCGESLTFESAPQKAVALGQNSAEIMLLLGLEDRMAATAFWPNKVLPELAEQIQPIALQATIGSMSNIIITGGLVLMAPVLFALLHPRREEEIETFTDFRVPTQIIGPADAVEERESRLHLDDHPATVPEWLERTPVLSVLLAALLGFALWHAVRLLDGFGRIDLNHVNLFMLVLGLLLHGSPARYVRAVDEAARGCGGIILQFPLYAAIMGMMSVSGLDVKLATALAGTSSQTTLPLLTFISASVVNLFVPSGGGQWAVQGPILAAAAATLSAPIAPVIVGFAWGDAWTNLIQPFWALPLLALTGVRAIDLMATLGRGQRVGIFAGPGVGKSTLLASIARGSSADLSVIALIGERGREVRDFIEGALGEEGLRRSVLVVATGDESPLMRVRAALGACAIAESFRDEGRDVLLMMDSITRFAHAQRQIGLSAGEPPATKGYTPSVFSRLSRLLERAGAVEPGEAGEGGSITGVYTILVDGDDLTEPIADAARGILDGHVILSRKLAQRGHYPAIDVLDSVSRVADAVTDEEHRRARRACLGLLADYREVEDLVQIGAYASGSHARTDVAIAMRDRIEGVLRQRADEREAPEESRRSLLALADEASKMLAKRGKVK